MNQQVMRFSASAAMLAIIVLLMLYLTFIEVPAGNKDIIITILGVLLGAGAAAIPNLFGDSDEEKKEMEGKIEHLEKTVERLMGAYETLDKKFNDMSAMLIDRHVIKGEGIQQ